MIGIKRVDVNNHADLPRTNYLSSLSCRKVQYDFIRFIFCDLEYRSSRSSVNRQAQLDSTPDPQCPECAYETRSKSRS